MSTMQTVYAAALADAFTQANWDAQRAMSLELLQQLVSGPGGVGGLVLAPWQHDTPSQALVNHSSPGGGFTTLGSITGINTGPDQYIFVIDDASGYPPVTRPFCIIKVFSGTTFSFDWGPSGVKCPNGIMAVNSTTAPSFTAGAADCFFSFTMRP